MSNIMIKNNYTCDVLKSLLYETINLHGLPSLLFRNSFLSIYKPNLQTEIKMQP